MPATEAAYNAAGYDREGVFKLIDAEEFRRAGTKGVPWSRATKSAMVDACSGAFNIEEVNERIKKIADAPQVFTPAQRLPDAPPGSRPPAGPPIRDLIASHCYAALLDLKDARLEVAINNSNTLTGQYLPATSDGMITNYIHTVTDADCPANPNPDTIDEAGKRIAAEIYEVLRDKPNVSAGAQNPTLVATAIEGLVNGLGGNVAATRVCAVVTITETHQADGSTKSVILDLAVILIEELEIPFDDALVQARAEKITMDALLELGGRKDGAEAAG